VDSLAAIFLSSFVLALSGAMMPGPLLTATIGESARRGPSTGPLLILGHGILEVALLLLLFLGLSPFFQNRWVFIGIALAGSLILFWMAAGKGRHLLSDRLYRGLIGTCAVFLMGFACYFLVAGLGRILA
jgi:threonine/homoserine/homoserine lactone efflux protein